LKTYRTCGMGRTPSMPPRFSVLIPVHNRKDFVCEAIDSVLAQTFPDYEVLVIDDGSTDGTADAIRSYGRRVRILHQANQGPEVARNLAASQADGEYLVMLDSDDLLMPVALETYNRVICTLGSPPVVIGSMIYFHDGTRLREPARAGDEIEVIQYRDFLSKDISIAMSNSRIIVNKALYNSVGGARNSSATTFHLDDFHLILKVGTHGPCVVVCRPVTVGYRIHGTNSIRNLTSMVNGIYSIIRLERKGEYAGGRLRLFARYACIGGIAWCWVKNACARRQFGQAVSLLFWAAPMVTAAACKKIGTPLGRERPLVLRPQRVNPDPGRISSSP
jgi:glycosyltransferase involved in cell wall biosynthesis